VQKLITEFPTLTVNEFTPERYFPDCLLDIDAIRGAIHTIFAGEFASEAEERGHRLPCGQEMNLDNWAPRQDDRIMLPFAWYLLGRVEQAWGHSVGLVFHHGGIDRYSEDQEHALADLFLGLTGSGVGLEDDFSQHLVKAAAVLNRYDKEGQEFDPRPYDEEMTPIRDLACAVWDLIDGGTVHLSLLGVDGPICGAAGTHQYEKEYVTCETCLSLGAKVGN
jgi:hypothetical protein